jgi:hypothetical protein
MIQAMAFVLVAALMCVASVLALFLITHISMGGVDAVARDGLARGVSAPAWSLADQSGAVVRSPAEKRLQVIVFADHSLEKFPSVADGLSALAADPRGPEVVVLLRVSSVVATDFAEEAFRSIGLGGVPIVGGSPSLYGRYNVRVMPFVIFVDSGGKVRASSLVNHDWQVARLWKIACMPLTSGELAMSRRHRRLLPRAQG